MLAEREEDFPDVWPAVQHERIRTALAVPLLREGVPVGAIMIRRMEVRPFSDKQIALLKTFADQAVIAIENVRLFRELGERNAELREALEHQTATAAVLSIISRSPTDVQPVLDAIVESAAKVCGIDDVILRLRDGGEMAVRAHVGPIPIARDQISTDEAQFRWLQERGTLHIPDARAQRNDFPALGAATGRKPQLPWTHVLPFTSLDHDPASAFSAARRRLRAGGRDPRALRVHFAEMRGPGSVSQSGIFIFGGKLEQILQGPGGRPDAPDPQSREP